MCNGRSCCDRFVVSGPYKLSPTHSVASWHPLRPPPVGIPLRRVLQPSPWRTGLNPLLAAIPVVS